MIIFTMAKIMARRSELRTRELGLELSGLQLAIMRALWHAPKTISDLSRSFMCDPSTLVPVIDALEGKGYLSRQRDPRDRRRNPLSLTSDGQEIIETVGHFGEHELFLDAVRTLGEDKTSQLITLLRELLHGLPESDEQLELMEERLRAFGGHLKSD
jgi:DNA-binding MarR family transcriptional regulator